MKKLRLLALFGVPAAMALSGCSAPATPDAAPPFAELDGGAVAWQYITHEPPPSESPQIPIARQAVARASNQRMIGDYLTVEAPAPVQQQQASLWYMKPQSPGMPSGYEPN
jgi:hypothetical protein